MFKGITPTFTLTLPEEVDLGVASNVYVTFANRGGKTLVQKKNDDKRACSEIASVFWNDSLERGVLE